VGAGVICEPVRVGQMVIAGTGLDEHGR
jgi:hypothetical protein